jgi:hypothetical protein
MTSMLKIARPRSRTTLVALPQRFLQDDGVRVDLIGTTFISKAGITSSTFKTISDVPVSSFELFLPEGRYLRRWPPTETCASCRASLRKTSPYKISAYILHSGGTSHERPF